MKRGDVVRVHGRDVGKIRRIESDGYAWGSYVDYKGPASPGDCIKFAWGAHVRDLELIGGPDA
jgi:hypothetical protein